jgi:hypothetical protein
MLPVDEMMRKLEALENRELPKGVKEKNPSAALGKVARPEALEGDRQREQTPPEDGVARRERKISEKTEVLGDFSKEESLDEVPPKDWEEKWKGLVDFTRARNPILGSFLVLGSLVHLSDEKIEIGFDKDSFHYERMLEKENRAQLESICHEYLQKKTRVIVSPLSLGVESRGRVVLNKRETILNESEKRSEKREEENPIIQEALRLFNGKIVEG